MVDLNVFSHDDFGSVRVATIDGEPFFVGKDVAKALGYSNSKDALAKHVEEKDKKILKGSDLRPLGNYAFVVIPNRGWTIISESGLYSLILSSKMPKAHQFKHWVTAEVLPTIRKHGVYVTDELLKSPADLADALKKLKAERELRKKLECEVNKQKHLITVLEPKASYCDKVLNSSDLVSITVIAKDYGWSGVRMNEYLRSHGIQYKQGYTWMLYAVYADKGYTGTKTLTFSSSDGVNHSKVYTYWTQKGRVFIYEILKADGILPLMEVQSVATGATTSECK